MRDLNDDAEQLAETSAFIAGLEPATGECPGSPQDGDRQRPRRTSDIEGQGTVDCLVRT